MLMGIPELTRARHVRRPGVDQHDDLLCLAWLDHPEISQETITNMSAQTLRSQSQARQGAEHTSEPAATPYTTTSQW